MNQLTDADLAELEQLHATMEAIDADSADTHGYAYDDANYRLRTALMDAMPGLLLLARVGLALDDGVRAGSPLVNLAEPMAAGATYLEAVRRLAAALATYRAACQSVE